MIRHRPHKAISYLLMLAAWSVQPAIAQTLQAPAPGAQPPASDAKAPISPLSHPEANDHDQDSGDDSKSKTLAPPPSLPGSHAEPIPVAPPDRDVSSMNPTDLLFDAINRGDITSVRDALSRGAEINAKNVLGQTPLALAVDLGRNEIAFLLLSLRGPDTSQDTQPQAHLAASPSSDNHLDPISGAASVESVTRPDSGFLGFGPSGATQPGASPANSPSAR